MYNNQNIENIKPLLFWLCVGNGGPHDESHFPLDDKWSKLNLLQEGTDRPSSDILFSALACKSSPDGGISNYSSKDIYLPIKSVKMRYLESLPSRDIPLRFPNDYRVTIVTTSKHHFFGFYLKTIAGCLASIP